MRDEVRSAGSAVVYPHGVGVRRWARASLGAGAGCRATRSVRLGGWRAAVVGGGSLAVELGSLAMGCGSLATGCGSGRAAHAAGGRMALERCVAGRRLVLGWYMARGG